MEHLSANPQLTLQKIERKLLLCAMVERLNCEIEGEGIGTFRK